MNGLWRGRWGWGGGEAKTVGTKQRVMEGRAGRNSELWSEAGTRQQI